MPAVERIYVALLDEAVDVWRPVDAEPVGGGVYRIVAQDYDRDLETWQFEPGEVVVVESIPSSDGPIRAATRRVGGPDTEPRIP